MRSWGGNMNISQEFKNAITEAFFDKEIKVYSIVEEVDEELCKTRKKGPLKATLNCNSHVISSEAVQKDYGLSIEANIMFTCNITAAQEYDLIDFKNKTYTCTGIVENDSHIKIFAKSGGI